MAFNTKILRDLYDKLNDIVRSISKEDLKTMHAEIVMAENKLSGKKTNENLFKCSLDAREAINKLIINIDLQEGARKEKMDFTSLRVEAIKSTKTLIELVERIIRSKK